MARTINIKDKNKNKLMGMINPLQSHYHEGSSMSKEVKLRWEAFVKEVGFERGVKE